jgi:hypothetical protein
MVKVHPSFSLFERIGPCINLLSKNKYSIYRTGNILQSWKLLWKLEFGEETCQVFFSQDLAPCNNNDREPWAATK